MRSIDKNVIYLGLVSFFTDMASSMVTTLLPLYLIYILHQGIDRLGIIIALSAFISYAFRILFGFLSTRYGIVKPFILSGYLISALAKPLLALTTSYAGVIGLRSAERMGKAVRSAPKDALISSYVKNGSDAKTFGFHKMLDIAGELSGIILIYLFFISVTQSMDRIKDIFFMTLFPGLIAVLIVIFFVRDSPAVPFEKRQKTINREDYRLLPLLFIYFFFLFFVISEQYIIVWVKASGFTLSQIALLMILYTLAQTLFSYYSGLISDKIGISNSLLIAFLLALLGMFILPSNVWISIIFLAFFTVMSLNTMRGFISKHARSKAFIYGIFYAGIAIFTALGALLMGYVWKLWGAEQVLLISQFGMSAIILLFLFWKMVSRFKNLKRRF